MQADELRELEFRDIAAWARTDHPVHLSIVVDEGFDADFAALSSAPNALYAFVCENEVYYIGKTARSIRARFLGYRFPAANQVTNIRCNEGIGAFLDQGREVRILVLVPVSNLQFGNFSLDLAAGLEESLIRHFQPPWNGGKRSRTETEELEETLVASESQLAEAQNGGEDQITSFEVMLGDTYYNKGRLNPGVEASQRLGPHGQVVTVELGNTEEISSNINRTANRNGSVRVIGHNRAIAEWFQQNFVRGDIVQGQVLSASRIRLLAPNRSQ